jgi:hypothetical protein
MKPTWFVITLLALAPTPLAKGADFSAKAGFNSIESFVSAAKAFKPATDGGDLAALFTIKQLGQPEDPETGKPVAAKAIASCDVLWTDETHAIVFVSAEPPIVATKAEAGVLFLLVHDHGHWKIADHVRFIATGKYADVSAELTAGVGTGYQLGSEDMNPVITIKESQGGRGYSYQLSGSYTFASGKFKRLELE